MSAYNTTSTNPNERTNLRTGKLGHGLGSFRHGMFGQFSRKHQSDRRLDLSAAQSCLLGISGKTSCLRGNAIEDIVDKRVHDGHALFGNSSVRVDLFEHAVNVRRPRLRTLLAALSSRRLLWCLLGGLLGWSLGHFDDILWVLCE